jgi:ATP-binding cassette, subfamily B, bacterial
MRSGGCAFACFHTPVSILRPCPGRAVAVPGGPPSCSSTGVHVRQPPRLRRALRFVWPHRGTWLGILALTLVVAALGAVEPLLLKAIFDRLEGRAPLGEALKVVGAIVLVGVGKELLSALANCLTWRTRLRIHHHLLDSAVGKLHRLPLDLHRADGVGAVMMRLDRGIQGFLTALSAMVFHLVPSLLYLVLAVVLMAQLDARLTLVVVAFTPLPALVAVMAAPVQVRREAHLFERWARIYSRFNEVLSGLVTVRSFAMEDVEKERFLDQVRGANDLVSRGVGFDSRVGAVQASFGTLARAAALGVGAYLVLGGTSSGMTVGTVVAFVGYVSGLFGPIQNLTTAFRTWRTASVSVDAIVSILDTQEHIGDCPGAVDPGPLGGDIRFEGVSFGYRADQRVLEGVNLWVPAGETVALVGPSGSGKSTLTALLQRFYDPCEGVVRIDGHDLRTLRQEALRRQIGVVLQDPLLFNDTVRNNIAYGQPCADASAIEAVARVAHAHAFIERLPQGYDTVVGERGAALSVGERQRIAIARALLKDPPIVILDEATSALDTETEALVQDALQTLLAGRTALIIAHRLATVVRADRIVVLAEGTIVEEGTHASLMGAGGHYARLVHRQVRGLAWQGAPPWVGPPPSTTEGHVLTEGSG